MNVIKKIELSILALSAVGVCASVAVVNTNKIELAIVGNASSAKTVTLTNAQLQEVALSDLEGGQHNPNNAKGDQKFIIPLEGGKCIHGAIIFNDCGHQFVGSTLGDAFGIDNTYSGAEKNAYNFSILFSFDKAIGMTTNITIETLVPSGDEKAELCAKFIKSTVAEGVEFFDRFKEGSASKYNYDKLTVMPQNASDYYSTERYQYAAHPQDLNVSSQNATIDADTETDGTYNVAAFQFTYNSWNSRINPDNKIDCTLQSLTFKYSCN